VALVAGVLATGCSDRSSRTLPTTPGPSTIASLVIGGDDVVLTGFFSIYNATATFPDGTTRIVSAAWVTSTPGVAVVDNAGRLEGRTHGSTTLTASYGGGSASKTVQVVNNYGGTWNGRVVIRTCDESGELGRDRGWCQAVRVGAESAIKLSLVQTASTPNEVKATIGSGIAAGARLAGVVSADGRLSLAGSITIPDWDIGDWATVRFEQWETSLVDSDAMAGRWVERLVFASGGTVHQANELVSMTRSSTAATSASVLPLPSR
jgi:hypothetical protein